MKKETSNTFIKFSKYEQAKLTRQVDETLAIAFIVAQQNFLLRLNCGIFSAGKKAGCNIGLYFKGCQRTTPAKVFQRYKNMYRNRTVIVSLANSGYKLNATKH